MKRALLAPGWGAVLMVVLSAGLVPPAQAADPLVPQATPPAPRFNRLYPYEQIVGFLKGYARSYPAWVKLESIGKSGGGRDMWLLTITNPGTGPELRKPAMYVDGNTHANEVQGTEATLYIIDFLLKNYGRLPRVTELLDRTVFYMVPVVNPDGRTAWFESPATAHFPRTVLVPIDDDRDGLADEDGYEDLNGDGLLTQMRKKVPLGQGTHKLDPKDSRLLVRIKDDEKGDWVRLGFEGFDNDGDGRVNEDPIGYVDPNRTWGYDWQPRYVQRGASDYPLQIPESRSIARWALTKPNIGAAQSFHNAGRMILRGPGSKDVPPYPPADVKVYDFIAKEGTRLLPGYRSMVVWKDLYPAHGTTVDHFYAVHGAIGFTNELYSAPVDLDNDGKISDAERIKFNDLLTLGRQFVNWVDVDHPQYGKIQVGGYRHDVGRVPETWMLEVESHRNCAFVLFHARQLPLLRFGEVTVKAMGGDLWRITAVVHNDRAIPSMTTMAIQNKLHRPDVVTVQGAKVLASGIVDDPYLDKVRLQKHRPDRLVVHGIRGRSHRRLLLVVKGQGTATLRYDSVKAGVIESKVRLN